MMVVGLATEGAAVAILSHGVVLATFEMSAVVVATVAVATP